MSEHSPLEPTDIWTADGHRVAWSGTSRRRPARPTGRAGTGAVTPAGLFAAAALAPLAVGAVAAGLAVAGAAAATGVASAAARALLGQAGAGGWPDGDGAPGVRLTVVVLDLWPRSGR